MNTEKPKRFRNRLLERVLTQHPGLLGDLAELYEDEQSSGWWKARFWLIKQMLCMLAIWFCHQLKWGMDMFFNYLKVALRHWMRTRLYSWINLAGLSIGLACCILILFFVQDELNHDRFHSHPDRIYSVSGYISFQNMRMYSESPAPMAGLLKESFEEIEETVCVQKQTVKLDAGGPLAVSCLGIESSFFRIFHSPLIQGNENAIDDIGSVMLEETLAKRLYGDESPLGKTLTVLFEDGKKDLRISGIFEKVPAQSSIRFQMLVNLELIGGEDLHSWEALSTSIFFKLKNRKDILKIEERLDSVIQPFLTAARRSGEIHYDLMPLVRYHLHGIYPGLVLEPPSRAVYSKILTIIALLVLMIACINFMNLSVGKSSSRLKEIGTRKVLGAQRTHLIKQFGCETLFHVLVAFVAAVVLAQSSLPLFNRFSGKSIPFTQIVNGQMVLLLLGLLIFVGIISGLYPSLTLSSVSAVNLFRGRFRFAGKSIVSKFLIVVQFAMSTFLIVVTLILLGQLRYILDKDLGYEYDQVLTVDLSQVQEWGAPAGRAESFKQECLRLSGVRDASAALNSMGNFWGMGAATQQGNMVLLVYNIVDADYPKTMGLRMIMGRPFGLDRSDEGCVLVNQTFCRQFEVEDPVGRNLNEFVKIQNSHEIIGVIEDFYHQSMHVPLAPTFLENNSNESRNVLQIRLEKGSAGTALPGIKAAFHQAFPEVPFSFEFLDTAVQKQYETENRWMGLMSLSTVLAILIACSGLFGLTLMAVIRRTKEIAMRKVLGASAMQILGIINREFILLIVAGTLLAFPAAYFAMKSYLQSFAYRIEISPLFFALAGIFSILLSLGTISLQSSRILWTNPAKNLRYE